LSDAKEKSCKLWFMRWFICGKSISANLVGAVMTTLKWARKMEGIGLMPSSTGKPGGKKSGGKVGDYVIAGGCFEKITAEV